MSFYSRMLESLLLPSHNIVRRRQYVRYRRFLEESQWWPREKLLDFQWNELRALLVHVFHSVPYYQKKYGDAGVGLEDIKCLQDVSRLPVLTRQEVNEHGQELRSQAYKGKLLPHATGGSSGTPTRFCRTIESYDWRSAATQRVYAWTGCRLGERAVYLWGAPVGHVPGHTALKKRAYEFFQRQLVFNTFSQTDEIWESIYQRSSQFQPRLIVGYVSSLEGFCRFLAARNLSLSGVKAVITAAEPLHKSTRQRIAQAIGAPVFNTYGCREFMSLAGECEQHRGLHINSENIFLETARPAGDGPSEILITDLHNYGMPFVRYQIGDVGLLDEWPCPCGRSLPRLQSVEGRVLDVLKTADGRVVPGEFFPHLLKDVPEIREFQVEQERLDAIVVRVVLSGALSDRSRQLLDTEIKKVFGDAVLVRLEPVEAISRLGSGKRRVTIGLG